MSIASHLARPAAAGLFNAAILHSEPFALPFRDPAAGDDLSNAFAQYSNCSDGSPFADWTAVEACLRNLTSDALLAAEVAATHDIAADWRRLLDLFVPWTPTCECRGAWSRAYHREAPTSFQLPPTRYGRQITRHTCPRRPSRHLPVAPCWMCRS